MTMIDNGIEYIKEVYDPEFLKILKNSKNSILLLYNDWETRPVHQNLDNMLF